MPSLRRAATLAASAAATTITGALIAAPAASAAAPQGQPAADVVYVQNDNPNGNQVFTYDRAADGTLSPAGQFATGGLGGVLDGSVVDHLASQGAVALDPAHRLLFAVNAGSNSVSVFGVHGDRLTLRQQLPSHGTFPVSVSVNGGLVYVLNARDGGSVSGFRISGRRVHAISHSTRQLDLDATATPEFTHTPGQVQFTPDGSRLLVTTKANGNQVDVYSVERSGRLGDLTVNVLPGTVPFSAAFDAAGHLLLTETGAGTVNSFAIAANGALSQLGSLATNQAATCWIAVTSQYAYASNAGSASLTGLTSADDGTLTSVGQTATDPGTVDAAASSDGRFLYVQAGASGIVDEYSIGSGGALTQVGSVTVPDAAGAEGIAAS